MFSVAALTIWRGGWPERTVAFGTIVGSLAMALFQNTKDWSAPQWGDLAVDSVFLLLVIWVALRSRKVWPMFAAAFQLVAVVNYVARLADARVGVLAPFTAGVIWSYLILLAVVVGVWLNRRAAPAPAPSPSTGSSST